VPPPRQSRVAARHTPPSRYGRRGGRSDVLRPRTTTWSAWAPSHSAQLRLPRA
jgi:hypothetical protein